MHAMDRFYGDPSTKPNLDHSLYSLSQADELEFFQTLTGIKDEEVLKEHVLSVQRKAYDLYGYPCIRRFNFLRLNNTRLPGYPKALKLLQVRQDPILLDIGCCFGNDTRKFVLDGWPARNVIASDLRQGFWECGHELFNSTPESFPVAFIQGDIFDPHFLDMSPPTKVKVQRPNSEGHPTTLPTLTSLSPLHRRISAIHASALFHLFSEDQQLDIARRLASLLLPQRGSIIFGTHVSRPIKGFRASVVGAGASDSEEVLMFCHSPESWRQMWMEEVFKEPDWDHNTRIHVEVELMNYKGVDLERDNTVGTESDGRIWEMQWSVEVL